MSLFGRSDKPAEPASDIEPQVGELQTARPIPEVAVGKPQEPAKSFAVANLSVTPTKAEPRMASIISKAVKITGQLESTEDLQIDGHIEGDVRGVGVKIGQSAKVNGAVYGEEVDLAGKIEGKIESQKVIVRETARMIGDVSHQEITVESGAYISGNLKPELGKQDTKLGPPLSIPTES